MDHEDRHIGPYRLLEPIGRGGMGVVYRAVHDDGRLVALKTVQLAGETQLASLRREIHALARLRHPGIVRILDEGVFQGRPWYTMELLEGVTLDRYVPPHPIPAPLMQRLGLVSPICAPLAYMHGEGLVHRDLKPANVLVRPDGTPVLMDFGLAAQFSGDVSRDALTAEGFMAGSVSGMAPEQIRGELVDARADIYALGCILYKLLTGRPPFIADHPVEVLWQHLHSKPEPLSKVVPDVPPPLEALVLQLLEKDPRRRLGHPDDVSAALGRLGVARGAELPAGELAELPRPRVPLYRPALAGRDSVLDKLEEHLKRLAGGQGTLLLVGGESGIGKTRLLLELARRAEQRNIRVMSGECMPEDASAAVPSAGALQPLRKTLRAIADRCRDRGREETERLLGPRGKVLAPYEPSLRELSGLERFADPIQLPAAAARLRLFGDLAETLRILAQEKPLLLLLDDLQWADELTLQFLGFLARIQSGSAAASQMTVVGSYRIEEIGEALRTLLDLPRIQQLRLARLDERAVGQMICDMLALPESPGVFARYLTKQSEGNPFFVAEYLRTAVREGVLWRDEAGIWKVTGEAGEDATEHEYSRLPLPQSIRALVARRLDRLAAPGRRLVDAAAVLGKGIEIALLATVSGLSSGDLLEATLELLGQQVMEDLGRGGLRFVHDKVREVAYEQLSERHRIELHRAAAEALDRLAAERRDEVLAALGHHWERAGVPDKARDCYLPAAKKAAARYALNEAEQLYRAYLTLVTEPTVESIDARAKLGHLLLRFQGRGAEAIEQFRLAVAEALQLNEVATGCTYLGVLAKLHLEIGKPVEAFELCDRALRIAQSIGSRWHEADIMNVRGFLLFDHGDLEQSRELRERALSVFRALGDRDEEAHSSANLAAVHMVQGRLAEGRVLLERTLEIALELHRPILEAHALLNLGLLHAEEGNYAEAYRLIERSIGLDREIGDRRSEGMALGRLADVQGRHGKMEEAMDLLRQALAFHREVENPTQEGYTLYSIATIERQCHGVSERAIQALKEAESILSAIGNTRELVVCLCERGRLALAAGESAREFLARARELVASLKAEPQSHMGQAIARLQRAIEAAEAGRDDLLFRGELLEDLPEGVRAWLVRTKQLSAEQARLSVLRADDGHHDARIL